MIMKKGLIFVSVLLAVLSQLVTGCDGMDENYATGSNYNLRFSTDTVSFDTIFSTIGSTTKQFMVYNIFDKPLNIQSIELAQGEKKGFRINVDGLKGTNFQDVEVRPNDSLYVFIEVTVNPNGTNQPLLIEDSVIFTTNGVRQAVKLQAFGQDVVLCKGGTILEKDTLLTSKQPYLVYDSLVIAKDATVTLEQGTRIFMHDKANLIVRGTLIAKGTRTAPIIIRGDRLDKLLDNLPYDLIPDQWGGIYFAPTSYGNILDHVVVRNGSSGITMTQADPEKSKLIIGNSQITNSDGYLFSAVNCNIEAYNTEFSNSGEAVVMLVGGRYSFTHCTIANNFAFGARTVPTLILSNNLTNAENKVVLYPLQKADFQNCIIDGNLSTGELALYYQQGTSQDAFNYQFTNCLIKSKEEANVHFTDILWGTSPGYRLSGEAGDYRYDFRPDSTSIVRGKAARSFSVKYPLDRFGVNRLNDSDGPDIGAYEYIREANE